MHFAAVLFLLQQLEVTPFPAEAGEPVSIRLTTGDAPQPGVAVAVELPDGSRRPVGSTDAKGEVRYVPVEPGLYCYRAELGGTRILAPHRVVPARRRWLAALICVPLALWCGLRLWRTGARAGAGPT